GTGQGVDETPAALAESIKTALGRVPVRADDAIDDAGAARVLGPVSAEAQALGGAELHALARVLRYARACSPGVEPPVRRVARWVPSDHLLIDATAKRHLELTESASGGSRESTLLGVIDQTRTAPG